MFGRETLCFVDLPLQTASRLPSWRQAIWPIADEDGVIEVGSNTARADVVVTMRAVVVGRARSRIRIEAIGPR